LQRHGVVGDLQDMGRFVLEAKVLGPDALQFRGDLLWADARPAGRQRTTSRRRRSPVFMTLIRSNSAVLPR
jgi:hypothetical protein